jgi:hypothetical protein
MKTKNFLAAGIAGGITNFLLGWLFYGILLKDQFPQPEESTETMVLIFLGCLSLGLLFAYIFTKWAQISTAASGAKAGLIIGLFIGLYVDLFNLAMLPDATLQLFAMDLGVTIVLSSIVGAVIGAVNGKIG